MQYGRSKNNAEEQFHNDLCEVVGCIACRIDGRDNYVCSIHHMKGRTKPGCQKFVLPLCADHHQSGTGAIKITIARHPDKKRFEAAYGPEIELLQMCIAIINRYRELTGRAIWDDSYILA